MIPPPLLTELEEDEEKDLKNWGGWMDGWMGGWVTERGDFQSSSGANNPTSNCQILKHSGKKVVIFSQPQCPGTFYLIPPSTSNKQYILFTFLQM